jgi:L-lactate utilization protein LutC
MQRPADDRVSEFSKVLTDLHGKLHVAKDEEELVRVVRGILSVTRPTMVAIAGIPSKLKVSVEAALGDVAHRFVDDIGADDGMKFLAECDASITWAHFAVAKQGALVEVVYDDAAKLASSLPFTHIAMVHSERVLPDLVEAMEEIGKLLSSSPKGQKPTVSFIGGPSKTGDIEMKLLYGVHGPHELHVIVLDWAERT